MQYLCECNDLGCHLLVEMPDETAWDIVRNHRVYLIVDGCQRGPEPGDVMVSTEPGWRVYQMADHSLDEKETVG